MSLKTVLSKARCNVRSYWQEIKALFILPVFLRRCPKCKGEIEGYSIKSFIGVEQYCCRKCKIYFPENDFSAYEDFPEVAGKRAKRRILANY
jgi:hypothetical protein